jgi:peroxiredoxin Q/BCP
MTDMIQAGDQAPALNLPTDGAGNVSLAALSGKTVVLYFYPKDDTPGCTNEAKAFSESADAFAALGAVVVGVSRDTVASHTKFKAKYGLNLILASDEDGAVVQAYGCWVEKNMYGRTYMGIERSTVLIGPDGKILKIWRKVKVPGHAQQVLEAIKGE